MAYTEATYLEMCNKYFAPLDEIAKALSNKEGMLGLSFSEILPTIRRNAELVRDLSLYENLDVNKL